MEDNEYQTSKYSTGVNINLRIDQLWKDSHLHSRTGRYNQWNLDLDCIWSELARDLKDKADKKKNIHSYEEIKIIFESFDKEILEHGTIKDQEQEGFKVIDKKSKESRAEHYKILRKKQLFLARLENTLGKGTTFDSNEEDDID